MRAAKNSVPPAPQPPEAKPPRVYATPAEDRLVALVRERGFIYLTIGPGFQTYRVPGVEEPVDGVTVARCVKAGRLIPQGDALFGMPAQTYIAA